MILSLSFQLLPNNSQVKILENMLNIGRNFWNYLIETDQNHYQHYRFIRRER